MDYMSVVQKEMQLNTEEISELKSFMERLISESQKEGIHFSESRKIAVAAHYISLIRRLKAGEYLPEMDLSAVKSQLDGKIMDIALKSADPIFSKYNLDVDEREVILIATHIGAAKEEQNKSEINSLEEGKL